MTGNRATCGGGGTSTVSVSGNVGKKDANHDKDYKQQQQQQQNEKRRSSNGKYIRECDSKRIRGIQVYKAKLSVGSDNPRKGKVATAVTTASTSSSSSILGRITKLLPTFRTSSSIRLYTIIFLVFYCYQGTMVLRSIGQPYQEFLLKADEEGFQVLQGSIRLRAEFDHQYRDLNKVDRRTTKLGWTDWMDMDIEQLAIEKKRDKEQSVLDSLPKHLRVPGKYQTSFWPTLVFGMLLTFHAFLLLLQQWSVSFNILMNYIEMDCDIAVDIMNNIIPNIQLDNYLSNHMNDDDGIKNTTSSTSSSNGTNTNASSTTSTPDQQPKSGGGGGGPTKYTKDASGNYIVFPDREITTIPSSLPTHARIISAKVDEKDVLVPIQYLPSLGMCVEYHRRRYYYNINERMWCKIRCQTTFPVTILNQWEGFQTTEALITAQIRFGPNLFQVKQPTFTELYQKQLLNPFSVFQIFCVLLWAIDDYITYSLFSLFMVLMFEGTVVFQRLKSLQALQSMGNPSRLIYVYRSKQWIPIDSAELLPGDIISLVRIKPHRVNNNKKTNDGSNNNDSTTKKPAITAAQIEDEGGDIVPADLVLLRGSTVVNEASLTGESVPQMKEGITELYDPTAGASDNNGQQQPHLLSMKLKHKMNVVYAGTKMLQCSGGNTGNGGDDTTEGTAVAPALFQQIPEPPDHGCTCFVLRTGFASAQGKLVRMIEGSQEKVKGHEKETGLLLGLLCIFAILSSSYVLYHGMQNKNRSKYELLLHCILIVTSVIRPELPMQMALAVNNSLMTLMKLHVFCTEPYRVPVAGKLTSCLFDKTGTLTTDELVATGICSPSKLFTNVNDVSNSVEDDKLFTPLHEIYNSEAALVLAGCQTLVVYEDETTGDPLESSALRAMRWQISATNGYAEPKPDTAKRQGGKPIVLKGGTTIQQVAVITRHHFSSKLQRMSCIVEGIISKSSKKKYAVAKGSPEAIGNLLGTKPLGYDTTSEYLSKQGYRVIALAYKTFDNDNDIEKAIESRAVCESNLVFAGFIAFTCMVRKDTADVLKRLKEGGMSVAMITGDALLTALHVAKEVHIVSTADETSTASNTAATTIDPELERNEELRKLIEEKRGKPIRSSKSKGTSSNNKTAGSGKPIAYLDIGSTGSLYWRSYSDGTAITDYVASDVPTFAQQYDLAMTGKCLAQALDDDVETRKVLGYIKVFARMTPDAKETVIEALHSVGELCLMCGDGANDVGALKQADVGVALLSGFGNLNVAKTTTEDTNSKESATAGPPVTAIMSQEHLNQIRALPVSLIKMKIKQLGTDPAKYPEIVEKEDLVKLYQIKAREVAIKRHDEQNALAKKNMTKQELALEKKLQMEEKQRQINARIAELEAQGVSFATFKVMKEFAAKEMEEARKKKGELQRLSGVEGHAAALAAQLEGAGGGGMDAMEDMGLPMVKLGDASIAAPFTSKMPSIRSCVDIVRQGRCTLVSSMQMYQIMALQCLISSYALSVLYLDGIKYGDTQMTAMGLLGTVSHLSISRSKPLDKLSRVQPLSSIFHPASFFSLIGQFVIHLTTMVLAVRGAKQHLPPDWTVDLDGEFKPGILNTVVFLISSVQQVTVFFVNLQGRPFMTGVSENRPLLWSLIATFILTFMFASESVPGLNRYFQLIPFPDEQFRDFILILLGVDLVATFALDRFMKFVFARDILRASIEETTMKDVMSMAKTFGILAFLMYTFLGNSDTWDQLLAMEQAILNATAEDASNGTLSTLPTITEALPDVTTVATPLHEEF